VDGLDQPEGPALLPDGTLVLVEMGEARACVTRIVESRRFQVARPGGRPTGLATDGDGNLWVAGGEGNSLVRISPDGDLLCRVEGDEAGPFLFPNDLAFGPDGLLYMTDSGMVPEDLIRGHVIRSDFATARYDGRLFQIDPGSGRVLRRIATGLRFTNGIVFGADAAIYFNETLTGTIYRQEIEGRREIFAMTALQAPTDRFRGPDGMAFDAAGRLYCAQYGEGRITVFDTAGNPLPSLPTNGDRPTNVVIDPATQSLLVTEVQNGTVEIIPVDAPPLRLHAPGIPGREPRWNSA
jgi:gluconolactonase